MNNKIIDLDGLGYFKTKLLQAIGTPMRYKGTKSTYNQLPSSENIVGDVWNVLDTGDNYAWDGSVWDKLGGTQTPGVVSAVTNGNGLLLSNGTLSMGLATDSVAGALSAAGYKKLGTFIFQQGQTEETSVVLFNYNVQIPDAEIENIDLITNLKVYGWDHIINTAVVPNVTLASVLNSKYDSSNVGDGLKVNENHIELDVSSATSLNNGAPVKLYNNDNPYVQLAVASGSNDARPGVISSDDKATLDTLQGAYIATSSDIDSIFA